MLIPVSRAHVTLIARLETDMDTHRDDPAPPPDNRIRWFLRRRAWSRSDIGLYLIVRQALYGNVDSDWKRGAQYLQDGFTNSNEKLRASNNQRLQDYFSDNSFFILTQQTVSGFDATNLKVQVYQPNGDLVAKSPNLQYTMIVNEDLPDQALPARRRCTLST